MGPNFSSPLFGLPLLETHAHLNGSIPPSAIAELVRRKSHLPGNEDLASFELPTDLSSFDIHDFFPLFGRFIYPLTDDAESVTFATHAVLEYFETSGCIYLELRTTPRAVPETGLTLEGYVDAVLAGFAAFSLSRTRTDDRMLAKLLLAVDRRHSVEVAEEVVRIAMAREEVVGIDVCGDPTKGDAKVLVPAFARAKKAGLKVTVHLGEIPSQIETQADDLLLVPDRLGHATFLSQATTEHILRHKLPIEICLTSNLICKTVPSLDEHHFSWALANDLPILLCTDDPLIFLNHPSTEYELALSLCISPTLESLVVVMKRSLGALFCSEEEKGWVRGRLERWEREREEQQV